LLLGGEVRLVAVTTSATCDEICRRHEANGALALALARAASAGLLLATLTKHEEKVSLQLLPAGPFSRLTVDATSAGRVRAYPHGRRIQLPVPTGARPKLATLVGGEGQVSVARDLGLKESFSGQTPFVSGEIDQDVEHYLVTSEQIDSVLVCDALVDPTGGVERAAGFLLQALPGGSHAQVLASERVRLHAGALYRALREAPDADPEGLARRVFGPLAADLNVLDTRNVEFSCPCSRERAEATLALLGKRELGALLGDPGVADVVCEFCRTTYHFSSENLESLRASMETPAGGMN
jgi:molecular chaperone Hsp33